MNKNEKENGRSLFKHGFILPMAVVLLILLPILPVIVHPASIQLYLLIAIVGFIDGAVVLLGITKMRTHYIHLQNSANTRFFDLEARHSEYKEKVLACSRNNQKVSEQIHSITQKINSADTEQLNLCIQLNSLLEDCTKDCESSASVMSEVKVNTGSLATTSEQLSTNVSVVATAAEEISASINDVAGSAAVINRTMTTVASTTEEMSSSISAIDEQLKGISSSIQGIMQNTRDGSKVAHDAEKAAIETNDIMSNLGSCAEEIGKVTNVIQVIAQQTNLLALNAAIEAASAGEAGKGFAVVANEVKELAKQTKNATEDISDKIHGIQNSTRKAVEAINQITEIITRINQLQGHTSSMIEKQTVGTEEISKNVSQTTAGVNEIAKQINEAATGVSTVSAGISEIASGANEVARNISEASASIHELNSKIAENSTMVGEANRYMGHAADSSKSANKGMQTMMLTVDKVCDYVATLEGIGAEENSVD